MALRCAAVVAGSSTVDMNMFVVCQFIPALWVSSASELPACGLTNQHEPAYRTPFTQILIEGLRGVNICLNEHAGCRPFLLGWRPLLLGWRPY